MLHEVHQEAVAGPRRLGGVDDRDDDVGLAQRVQRRVHHPHVEPVQRPMNARRVDEDDLPVGPGADADDAVPGRLRLVRDDRQLVADEPVEQRRLAGVGPADEGDESRFIGRGSSAVDRRPAAHADPRDAASLGFEHFDRQAVDVEPFARRRHAAERGQQVAADGLEALALDLDARRCSAPARAPCR